MSKSSVIYVIFPVQDQTSNDFSGCRAGHCFVFSSWSLEARKQISSIWQPYNPLCNPQEIYAFLKTCVYYFPWIPGHHTSNSLLHVRIRVTPWTAVDIVRTQIQIHVWKTHQDLMNCLNKNRDDNICWNATCFLGYRNGAAILCFSWRHTTAEVACHSWKA